MKAAYSTLSWGVVGIGISICQDLSRPSQGIIVAVKANCRAKREVVYMFLISAIRSYFTFLNFRAYFSLRNSTLASRNYSYHLKILKKNILLSVQQSTTAAYSKLRMFDGKTCHVCKPNYNVFYRSIQIVYEDRTFPIPCSSISLLSWVQNCEG